MQRRVFVGIEMPQQIKKRLFQIIQKWQDLPIKWGSEDNYHITLSFLGYVDDAELPEICRKINLAAQKSESFDINFSKIGLGPDAENPKMVWLVGEASEDLRKLQENIEKELGMFVREKKEYYPHVTLGRIRKIKWTKLKDKPLIDEKFSANIPVDNIFLFESRMEDRKRRYDILEACPLK